MNKSFNRLGITYRICILTIVYAFLLSPGFGEKESGPAQRIYKIEELDKRPKPLRNSEQLPGIDLRPPRAAGTASVEFIIDQKGIVSEIRQFEVQWFLEVFSDEEKEKVRIKICDALDSWRFSPGIKDGSPVVTVTKIEIPFMENILEPVAGGDATR